MGNEGSRDSSAGSGDRYSETVKEKGVSNHQADREWSNRLDNAMGWKDGYKDTSHVREFVHTRYHERMASKKENSGNDEGAKAERDRAQQIRDKCNAAREAEKAAKEAEKTAKEVFSAAKEAEEAWCSKSTLSV